jgi:hypothetical protein
VHHHPLSWSTFHNQHSHCGIFFVWVFTNLSLQSSNILNRLSSLLQR